MRQFLWAVCVLHVVHVACEDCLDLAVCQDQVKVVVQDIRDRVTDRLQQDVQDAMGVAPAAVNVTLNSFEDAILSTDMSETRYEDALLEHFWYQLRLFSSVSWLYYGDEASGNFIGLRRSWACEVDKSCDYGPSVTVNPNRPTVPAGSIVRLITDPATKSVAAYSTDPKTGSNAVAELYTETFNTKGRPWYTAAVEEKNTWIPPYPFTGGVLGVTVSRKVTNAAGAFVGVLAADYESVVLNNILTNIPVEKDEEGATNTRLFVMNMTSFLLASNNGAKVVKDVNGVDVPLTISESTDEVIRTAGTELMKRVGSLPWESVLTAEVEGEIAVGSADYFYDAVGIDDVEWVVAIAFPKADYYPVTAETDGECAGRVVKFVCREILENAARDLRARTLRHFAEYSLRFLESGYVALSTMDAAYNMGNLNNGWCDSTCGPIEWSDTQEIALLEKQTKNTLLAYSEIAWLYAGFEDEGKVLGYRNTKTQLEKWKTCTGDVGCTNGSAFYNEAGDVVLTRDGYEIKQTAWYTLPTTLGMSTLDEIAWTEPYIFTDGDIGFTIVKLMMDGDWNETKQTGVWAADYTVEFINNFINTFDLQENSIVYIMDDEGNLMAASSGITVKTTGTVGGNVDEEFTHARESDNSLVKKSADIVFPRFNSIPTDDMFSALINYTDTEDRMRVDAMRLRDRDTVNTLKSFDWVIVTVTPESDVYDIGFDDEEEDDDGFPVWAIIVIIVGSVVVIAGAVAAAMMYKKSASGAKFAEPTLDNGEAFMNTTTDANDLTQQSQPMHGMTAMDDNQGSML